jgi:hypothetical protein
MFTFGEEVHVAAFFFNKSEFNHRVYFSVFDYIWDCLGSYSSIPPRKHSLSHTIFFRTASLNHIYDLVNRTDFTLDLLEQRINDLSANTGTKQKLDTLEYLNKAVDQATTAISHVPQEQGGNIR